jgi:hypothetical protein
MLKAVCHVTNLYHLRGERNFNLDRLCPVFQIGVLMKTRLLEDTLHSIRVTLVSLTIRYDQEKLQGDFGTLRQREKLKDAPYQGYSLKCRSSREEHHD